VWSAPGRTGATLQEFFELLGDRTESIQAVSIDMSEPYAGAIRRWLPEAEIAFDPFHVIALAGAAVDKVRLSEWQAKGPFLTPGGLWIRHTRWALLKAPEKLTDHQRLALVSQAGFRGGFDSRTICPWERRFSCDAQTT
jgi:transposase